LFEILGDYTTSVKKSLKEIDKNYLKYDALVIAGSHNPHNVEEYIQKIYEARITGRPYYGECWGHQLACIEYARSVLGITDATSEEWGQGTFVIRKRPTLKVGLHNGESYWNNYEVAIDWEKPKNFFTAQFHASYQSSIDRPHPLLVEFLLYAKNKMAMQN